MADPGQGEHEADGGMPPHGHEIDGGTPPPEPSSAREIGLEPESRTGGEVGGPDAARPASAASSPAGAGGEAAPCPACDAPMRGGVPGARWCLRCGRPPEVVAAEAAAERQLALERSDRGDEPERDRPGGTNEGGGGDATGPDAAPDDAAANDDDDARAAARPLVRPVAAEPWRSRIVALVAGIMLVAGALGGWSGLFDRAPLREDGRAGWLARFEALVQAPLRVGLWTGAGLLVLGGIAWYERRPIVASRRPGGDDPAGLGDAALRTLALMTVAHLPLLLPIRVPAFGFLVESLLQAALAIACARWLFGWRWDRSLRWLALVVLVVASALLAGHLLTWVLGPPL